MEMLIYFFDGFKVYLLYDDFIMLIFDNKYNLIKGGSWILIGNEVMKYSCYVFRWYFF